MTFISENIIPGNHGKTFTTDITEASEKAKLEASILKVEGVVKVVFEDIYPLEFTVHTDRLVNVSEIQSAANEWNYHVIAKGPFFPLF